VRQSHDKRKRLHIDSIKGKFARTMGKGRKQRTQKMKNKRNQKKKKVRAKRVAEATRQARAQ